MPTTVAAPAAIRYPTLAIGSTASGIDALPDLVVFERAVVIAHALQHRPVRQEGTEDEGHGRDGDQQGHDHGRRELRVRPREDGVRVERAPPLNGEVDNGDVHEPDDPED